MTAPGGVWRHRQTSRANLQEHHGSAPPGRRGPTVVLTTYETMRDYHFSFSATRFGLIVFDEIQKLKNPAVQVTSAAKALNADFLLGMTGTPVENSLNDLWSVMDVVASGYLGSSRDFAAAHVDQPPERNTSLRAKLMPAPPACPHILRRLKEDSLTSLPAKTVERYCDAMPAIQAQAYAKAVNDGIALRSASAPGAMLETLHRLRGVSLSAVAPDNGSDEELIRASARLTRMMTILDKIRTANEKALVF
jgi:SNF2 family DNA or RNA helicase